VRGIALAALVVGAAIAACSSGEGDSSSISASSNSCFLAFAAQFDGFRSWTSYHYEGTDEGDGGVHVAGPRTEYVNRPPPRGSTAFPVGTIIVKEVGAGDPANHHLFAMAKRGCDFNAQGAKDWEWIELTEAAPGATVLWRGVGPPAGETYGGDPTGCNSCHAACTDNDSVCSTRVRLSGF
jgi:hypothetical protein